MLRNPELDSIKQKEQAVFRRKQIAFQKYKDAKERAGIAYDAMRSAWNERSSTREAMNREYEIMQQASLNYQAVWEDFRHIRDANNSRIKWLRDEADREHEMMKSCFDRASAAYECGDKSEAPIYASEGHEHKERRDELNTEIGDLIREIIDAKQDAEWRAPKTDSSAFREAKDAFEQAKSRHESAQAEFKRLKAERDRLKDAFESLHEEHVRLKEEFQKKLEEVKSANKREREKNNTNVYHAKI